MGLSGGYGVLIDTKSDYYRDDPDNLGLYYHGNLIVRATGDNYHCAIDVDPKFMPDGIQWRTVEIRENNFAGIRTLADGWHPVPSNALSGALDYIRSSILHPPLLNWNIRYDSCLSRFLDLVRWNPPWNSGTGIQALISLEGIIDRGIRFYIFGEPFSSGLSVRTCV